MDFLKILYFYQTEAIQSFGICLIQKKQLCDLNERLINEKKWHKIAYKDALTGLKNRTAYVENINNLERNLPKDSHVSIIMIDIDDFKNINDTYGHDDGDEVLKFLGKLLKKHSNKAITSYRYGGEEFTIIFSKKNLPDAVIVTEKILNEFRKHTFKFANRSFTFSAGVAEYSVGLDSETFFERADQLLYQAKRTGKNRILT